MKLIHRAEIIVNLLIEIVMNSVISMIFLKFKSIFKFILVFLSYFRVVISSQINCKKINHLDT